MNLLHPKYRHRKFRPLSSLAAESLIFIVIFGFVWAALFLAFNFKAYANRLAFDLGLGDWEKSAAASRAALADDPGTPAKADNLVIPRINVAAPLVVSRSAASGDILKDLENGVALYPGSAEPGNLGKTVILGHSSGPIFYKGDFSTVFSLIDKLEKGDEVIVNYEGKSYSYRVEEKIIRRPSQILRTAGADGLYLVSCWPVGTDLERIAVRAVLI